MNENYNWTYTDKVKDHFVNPRNVLSDSENFVADGEGVVGNMKCGDQMLFKIKIDKSKETISDCRWKTYGCASAIASTSALSEMVKNMSLEEAYNLSPKDIIKKLGSLPENKIHCSVLGDKALQAAIDDYYLKTNQENRLKAKTIKIICECLNITDKDIEEAVEQGARSFQELQEKTKISTVCGECKEEATVLLISYVEQLNERKNHNGKN